MSDSHRTPSDEEKGLLALTRFEARLWDGESNDPLALIVLGDDHYCAKWKATPEQLKAHALRAERWRRAHAADLDRGWEVWGK